MNANRVTIALAVLAVIAITLATASFAEPPKAASLPDDFALRHPDGLPGVAADLAVYYRGSDYAERHPANAIAGSDYFLRHPELMAADSSDFFLRHAEWSTLSPVIDTSDYYLRHPELIVQ